MSDSIRLEIVTPRGLALSVQVDEVTAPGSQGEFGVLPGHLPLLAALRSGIVTYRQGTESKRCAVGAGFAEAGPDKLVILTDDWAERADVDPVLVRKELGDIQQQIAQIEAGPLAGADIQGAEAAEVEARSKRESTIARENWLAVQLELYGDPLPATQRPYEEFGPPPPPDAADLPASSEAHDAPANESR